MATDSIRSTIESDVIFGDVSKGVFSDSWYWSDKNQKEFAILTNVGILRFDFNNYSAPSTQKQII